MMALVRLVLLLLFSSVVVNQSGVVAETVCHSPTDAIIILDASGSVGFKNWQKTVKFAADLGNALFALHLSNKVGVVEYSQIANEAICLTKNKDDFDHGIQVLNETYQNGITRTELALSKAVEMFKKESLESDSKVIVIITDGKTTPVQGIPGTKLILGPTTELKQIGVNIIAVGVGENINIEELNLMATDPDSSNVLKMSDYDDLLKKVNTITQVACPTVVTTPTTQPNSTKPEPVTTKSTPPTPSTLPTPATPPPIPVTTPSVITTAPTPITSPSPHTPGDKCNAPFHKIGCFHDDMKVPRPLPDLVFTDRDETSPVSTGLKIDWDNWGTYLSDLVCRCSKAAKEKGYSFFSIQYYGECWSGAEAGETYKRNGISAQCITNTGQPCTPDKPDVCAGEAETNYVYGIDIPRESTCDIPYEKLGCYQDNHVQPRPLNELILTDRDPGATAIYSGKTIQWGTWDTYLVDLVCRCARKAAEKKYNYFGIQFYGECWSGAEAGDTFGRDGTTDTCVTFGYKKCPSDPKANIDQCVGKEKTNYVYGIRAAAPQCSVKYERVGCYNDKHSEPRPLPQLILTDRDPSDKVYSNITIDWGNWDSYIDDLVCRCARVAQIKRFPYFGIQNYGECWSGPEGAETYGNDGESANCITDKYQPCQPSSTECVGKDNANFVYKVQLK